FSFSTVPSSGSSCGHGLRIRFVFPPFLTPSLCLSRSLFFFFFFPSFLPPSLLSSIPSYLLTPHIHSLSPSPPLQESQLVLFQSSPRTITSYPSLDALTLKRPRHYGHCHSPIQSISCP